MIRRNHYEAAFEAYLRRRRIPYVAVDESRRSLLDDGSIKSPDFLVSPGGVETAWLVDVKGRRFPSGHRRQQFWKNWSTGDELRSLAAWERLFGANFVGALVFAYNVVGDRAPLPAERLFVHRGSLYGFVAVRLAHYLSAARQISPRWDTLSMPAARFRELAEPADEFFGAADRQIVPVDSNPQPA